MKVSELDVRIKIAEIATEEASPILGAVLDEYVRATQNFGEFNSAHEGLAVIREEYLELEAEIFKNQMVRDPQKIRREAIQLAAMAVRLIHDVVDA